MAFTCENSSQTFLCDTFPEINIKTTKTIFTDPQNQHMTLLCLVQPKVSVNIMSISHCSLWIIHSCCHVVCQKLFSQISNIQQMILMPIRHSQRNIYDKQWLVRNYAFIYIWVLISRWSQISNRYCCLTYRYICHITHANILNFW